MKKLKSFLIFILVFSIFTFIFTACENSKQSINNVTAQDQTQETYAGSKESNKYHHAWCKYAKKIKQSNLITFPSKSDAEKQGYIPCKVCRP